MQIEQAVNQQAVGQLYIVKQVLEEEVQRLQKAREDAGRFLKIDEELRELDRVTKLKESVIAEAEMDASAIREKARAEAETVFELAAADAKATLEAAEKQAKLDAAELIREAEQTAKALRESAAIVYKEARQKTAGVDEYCEKRYQEIRSAEDALADREVTVVDREKALLRVESLVDGKRSMLRAGIVSLQRVLDEVNT